MVGVAQLSVMQGCSLLHRLEWDQNKCPLCRTAGCPLLRGFEYTEVYGNIIRTFRIQCPLYRRCPPVEGCLLSGVPLYMRVFQANNTSHYFIVFQARLIIECQDHPGNDTALQPIEISDVYYIPVCGTLYFCCSCSAKFRWPISLSAGTNVLRLALLKFFSQWANISSLQRSVSSL